MRYLLITSLFLICACSQKVKLAEIEETGAVSSIDMSKECVCDELIIGEDNKAMLNDSLYTGKCYSNYPDTDIKYVEKSYWKGQLHGHITYFDKNGKILAEEEYAEGSNTKSATEKFVACACSELTKEKGLGGYPDRWFRNNSPFSGVCHEYFPETDVIYIKANYRDGVKHGPTRYYDKEGNELFMEEYKMGELYSTVRPE